MAPEGRSYSRLSPGVPAVKDEERMVSVRTRARGMGDESRRVGERGSEKMLEAHGRV